MYVMVPYHKMSPKGHTELIIGVSGAKDWEESDFNVRFFVAPQKSSEKLEKQFFWFKKSITRILNF